MTHGRQLVCELGIELRSDCIVVRVELVVVVVVCLDGQVAAFGDGFFAFLLEKLIVLAFSATAQVLLLEYAFGIVVYARAKDSVSLTWNTF